MSNEYRSGYESGEFKEAPQRSFQNENKFQNSGNYSRHDGSKWNRSSGSGSQGQSGNFQRYNRFTRGAPNKEPRDFSVDPPELYKPYVGTGNVDAPESVLQSFKEIRELLQKHGYTVRTSAFDGPDKVFVESSRKELILPWKGFGNLDSKLTFTTEEAKFFAKQFHPAYDNMKDTVKTFLAKNVRLVCGQNLKSPALFVLLWTEDGIEDPKNRSQRTGNAGHVISIAHELRIPIFNFGDSTAKDRLIQYLRLDSPV